MKTQIAPPTLNSAEIEAAIRRGDMVDFRLLNPIEMAAIIALGQRAKHLVMQFREQKGNQKDELLEANYELLNVDFAIVHLRVGLNLQGLLHCNNLEFIEDFHLIEKNIDRAKHFFPTWVKLRFAQRRAH